MGQVTGTCCPGGTGVRPPPALAPEKVEKTNHPSGNSEGKVLKSSRFLPKTRVEQRSVNKIYPLN